jgi:hypothetical protein
MNEVPMMDKKLLIPVVVCLLCMLGCAGESDRQRREKMEQIRFAQSAPAGAPNQGAGSQSTESQRFIAVRHDVIVETTEDELKGAWESVGEFCHSIHCEIMASAIRQNSDSPATASLSLRVAPEDTKQLVERVGKAGKIIEHKTTSDDKTGTVIDVDAKIKNLIELRDRLRQLLASPSGSFRDIVDVERELSRVQSELDSFQMKRKALANETEKTAVEISFRSKKPVVETGTFSPVAAALRSAGSVLAESIAFAITFVVAIIPWLVIFIPTLWLLIKGIKRLRRKRTGTSKTQAPE